MRPRDFDGVLECFSHAEEFYNSVNDMIDQGSISSSPSLIELLDSELGALPETGDLPSLDRLKDALISSIQSNSEELDTDRSPFLSALEDCELACELFTREKAPENAENRRDKGEGTTEYTLGSLMFNALYSAVPNLEVLETASLTTLLQAILDNLKRKKSSKDMYESSDTLETIRMFLIRVCLIEKFQNEEVLGLIQTVLVELMRVYSRYDFIYALVFIFLKLGRLPEGTWMLPEFATSQPTVVRWNKGVQCANLVGQTGYILADDNCVYDLNSTLIHSDLPVNEPCFVIPGKTTLIVTAAGERVILSFYDGHNTNVTTFLVGKRAKRICTGWGYGESYIIIAESENGFELLDFAVENNGSMVKLSTSIPLVLPTDFDPDLGTNTSRRVIILFSTKCRTAYRISYLNGITVTEDKGLYLKRGDILAIANGKAIIYEKDIQLVTIACLYNPFSLQREYILNETRPETNFESLLAQMNDKLAVLIDEQHNGTDLTDDFFCSRTSCSLLLDMFSEFFCTSASWPNGLLEFLVMSLYVNVRAIQMESSDGDSADIAGKLKVFLLKSIDSDIIASNRVALNVLCMTVCNCLSFICQNDAEEAQRVANLCNRNQHFCLCFRNVEMICLLFQSPVIFYLINPDLLTMLNECTAPFVWYKVMTKSMELFVRHSEKTGHVHEPYLTNLLDYAFTRLSTVSGISLLAIITTAMYVLGDMLMFFRCFLPLLKPYWPCLAQWYADPELKDTEDKYGSTYLHDYHAVLEQEIHDLPQAGHERWQNGTLVLRYSGVDWMKLEIQQRNAMMNGIVGKLYVGYTTSRGPVDLKYFLSSERGDFPKTIIVPSGSCRITWRSSIITTRNIRIVVSRYTYQDLMRFTPSKAHMTLTSVMFMIGQSIVPLLVNPDVTDKALIMNCRRMGLLGDSQSSRNSSYSSLLSETLTATAKDGTSSKEVDKCVEAARRCLGRVVKYLDIPGIDDVMRRILAGLLLHLQEWTDLPSFLECADSNQTSPTLTGIWQLLGSIRRQLYCDHQNLSESDFHALLSELRRKAGQLADARPDCTDPEEVLKVDSSFLLSKVCLADMLKSFDKCRLREMEFEIATSCTSEILLSRLPTSALICLLSSAANLIRIDVCYEKLKPVVQMLMELLFRKGESKWLQCIVLTFVCGEFVQCLSAEQVDHCISAAVDACVGLNWGVWKRSLLLIIGQLSLDVRADCHLLYDCLSQKDRDIQVTGLQLLSLLTRYKRCDPCLWPIQEDWSLSVQIQYKSVLLERCIFQGDDLNMARDLVNELLVFVGERISTTQDERLVLTLISILRLAFRPFSKIQALIQGHVEEIMINESRTSPALLGAWLMLGDSYHAQTGSCQCNTTNQRTCSPSETDNNFEAPGGSVMRNSQPVNNMQRAIPIVTTRPDLFHINEQIANRIAEFLAHPEYDIAEVIMLCFLNVILQNKDNADVFQRSQAINSLLSYAVVPTGEKVYHTFGSLLAQIRSNRADALESKDFAMIPLRGFGKVRGKECICVTPNDEFIGNKMLYRTDFALIVRRGDFCRSKIGIYIHEPNLHRHISCIADLEKGLIVYDRQVIRIERPKDIHVIGCYFHDGRCSFRLDSVAFDFHVGNLDYFVPYFSWGSPTNHVCTFSFDPEELSWKSNVKIEPRRLQISPFAGNFRNVGIAGLVIPPLGHEMFPILPDDGFPRPRWHRPRDEFAPFPLPLDPQDINFSDAIIPDPWSLDEPAIGVEEEENYDDWTGEEEAPGEDDLMHSDGWRAPDVEPLDGLQEPDIGGFRNGGLTRIDHSTHSEQMESPDYSLELEEEEEEEEEETDSSEAHILPSQCDSNCEQEPAMQEISDAGQLNQTEPMETALENKALFIGQIVLLDRANSVFLSMMISVPWTEAEERMQGKTGVIRRFIMDERDGSGKVMVEFFDDDVGQWIEVCCHPRFLVPLESDPCQVLYRETMQASAEDARRYLAIRLSRYTSCLVCDERDSSVERAKISRLLLLECGPYTSNGKSMSKNPELPGSVVSSVSYYLIRSRGCPYIPEFLHKYLSDISNTTKLIDEVFANVRNFTHEELMQQVPCDLYLTKFGSPEMSEFSAPIRQVSSERPLRGVALVVGSSTSIGYGTLTIKGENEVFRIRKYRKILDCLGIFLGRHVEVTMGPSGSSPNDIIEGGFIPLSLNHSDDEALTFSGLVHGIFASVVAAVVCCQNREALTNYCAEFVLPTLMKWVVEGNVLGRMVHHRILHYLFSKLSFRAEHVSRALLLNYQTFLDSMDDEDGDSASNLFRQRTTTLKCFLRNAWLSRKPEGKPLVSNTSIVIKPETMEAALSRKHLARYFDMLMNFPGWLGDASLLGHLCDMCYGLSTNFGFARHAMVKTWALLNSEKLCYELRDPQPGVYKFEMDFPFGSRARLLPLVVSSEKGAIRLEMWDKGNHVFSSNTTNVSVAIPCYPCTIHVIVLKPGVQNIKLVGYATELRNGGRDELIKNAELFLKDAEVFEKKWSRDMDQAILRSGIKLSEDRDVVITSDVLESYPILGTVDQRLLAIRLALIGELVDLMRTVPEGTKNNPSPISLPALIAINPSMIPFELKMECLDRVLSQMRQTRHLDLTFNRSRAAVALSNRLNPKGRSLLDQLMAQVSRENLHLLGRREEPWRVLLEGEGATDAGGPGRDVFSDICREILHPSMKLFIECPGKPSEGFIPCNELGDTMKTAKFTYVGAILAIAIMSKLPQPFPFMDFIWNSLCELPLTKEQVISMDPVFAKEMEVISSIATKEEFDDMLDLHYTVTGLSGVRTPLMKGGATERVTFENRLTYVDMCFSHRIHEFDATLKAMKDGFSIFFSGPMGKMWLPWELKQLICGDMSMSVEEIKQHCRIIGSELPDPAIEKLTEMLWEALGRLSPDERRLFIKFATGRTSLPAPGMTWNAPLVIRFQLSPGRRMLDEVLPTASTCSSTIVIPNYSSVDIMEKRIRVAIRYALDIERDHPIDLRQVAPI